MPLHKRESVREGMLDSIYADHDLHAVPALRPRFPIKEMRSERRVPVHRRRADARRQRPPEPGHLLPDLGGARGPSPDGHRHRQEPDRQGRVPPDGRARAPLRAHAGRPVERARDRTGRGLLGHRLVGGLHARAAWRPSGGGGPSGKAAGKPTDSPNMVCGPVQVVWHKFARYWDVEMREIPMAPGRYCMDVEQMLERVDENTIMVVPTFGVTYTGSYEPVLELSQALDKLQEEKGLDIDIHVDGASGAFLAPFCAPDILWDFRVPRVKSISTSGHKFGLAPLGVGWVLWRDVSGAARRPDLPRDVPGRRHAGLPDQLLAAGRPDRRAVLQLRPARPGRLPQRARRLLPDGQVPGPRDRQARAVRDALRRRPPDGDPLGGLAHPRGRGPGLHALRHRRPPAQPRLAGARPIR